jgi:hypothetical protein
MAFFVNRALFALVCVSGIIQLYTLTTIILVLQTIYYDHVMRWWAGDREEVEDLFPEVSLYHPTLFHSSRAELSAISSHSC